MKKEETSFHSDEPLPDENDFAMQEEEEKNKILLAKLKEEQTKHREFVKKLELERKVKEELDAEQRVRELVAKKAYIERRNASAKVRAKQNNERLSKLLAKVEGYMRTIKNIDSIDQIKKQAEKEYEEEIKKNKKKIKPDDESIKRLAKLNNKNDKLRDENIKKIKEREKEEKKKKEKIRRAKKENERINNILNKGYENVVSEEKKEGKKKVGGGFFQEEEQIEGTNASPDMMMGNNDNNNISPQNENKTKYLPNILENNDRNAENELRQILKTDKDNLKKLLAFSKKYKGFDISSYIHKAKMNQIKSQKVVKSISTVKPGITAPISSSSYPNYLSACKYNSQQYIQSFLLNAKDDLEVFMMINEKDEFDRNGLMYLIIHNNLTMIKLTLLSGVILSDCCDIYGRNLIHYCCLTGSKSLLDAICHCIMFENKENFDAMNRYVEKCIGISEEESHESNEYYEQEIVKFDNLVENKKLAYNPEEREKKKEEESQKEENERVQISENKKHTGAKIISNKIDLIREIKRRKVPMKKLVNTADIDGDCPIHIACKNNDLDKIEVLVYFGANLGLGNAQGKKGIELTTSDVIQQYLLKNEKNAISRMNLNATMNCSKKISNHSITNFSVTSCLDMEKIKFYPPEKINSFTTGYENNNYLILSVLQNNYDMFRYLLTEKNAKADFVNAVGATVIYYILQKQLYHFFAFLFMLPASCDSPKKILDELQAKQLYKRTDIYKSNGELSYLGSAIKAIDAETNRNENALTVAVEKLKSLDMFKALLIIYNNYIEFFNISPMDIIINRQYGKNKQTLLVKAVESNCVDILKYLLEEFQNSYCKIDIYQGDIKKMNMLHYAVINKKKDIIRYLIKFDAERNVLRTAQDSKGKKPSDYDNGKVYVNEMTHIWDACSKNDIDLIDKLVTDLEYYKVDDQLPFCKYTPLHVAAKYMSDKAILYLVKAGCNVNIKNRKKLTALEMVLDDPTKPKAFITKFKRILKKEIVEYVDLSKTFNGDLSSQDKTKDKNNTQNTSLIQRGMIENKRLKRIIETVKNEILKRKLNMKKIFKKLDTNGNGTLEGSEFECLFLVLDIPNVTKDDVLLLNSYLDENKNGLIEYEEFIKILE